MNAIVFDPKTKSAEITSEQLSQTMRLGDGFGNMPPQCPLQPGVLITDLKELIRKHCNVEPIERPIVIKEIYCQSNRSGDGPLELKDYIIKRFVTKIEIPLTAFSGNDAMRPAIALSYVYTDSVRGIQIGFGENVSVCDNLTVFGKFLFSTYGNSKIPFADGLQLLNYWLEHMQVLHDRHINCIERMMAKKVDKKTYLQMIGILFERSVQSNMGQNVLAPLNQSQVSQMVSKGIVGYTPEPKEELLVQPGTKDVSVWEILNWGTATLRPESSDMISYIKNSALLNDFISETFNIDVNIVI